ncbi:MAG: hypothetical protein PHC61_08180 [Chitinivibrionales bacterium]|nr:hypothetical protein [Chitinivibrionales bacterium]
MPSIKHSFFTVSKSAILSLSALAILAVSAAAGTFSVYHVGNSLTGDLFYDFKNVATRYEATQGNSYTWGLHFWAGHCLTIIYLHPDSTDGTGVQTAVGLTNTSSWAAANTVPWTTALPNNHWDVVTMQPFPAGDQGPNLLKDNIAAVNGMIAKAKLNNSNASTRFFIYGAWSEVTIADPGLFSRTYSAATIKLSNPDSTPGSTCRDFIEMLCDSVRKTNPDVSVIPVGEVLYALDQKMQNHEFNDFTSLIQFHRGNIHGNSAGQNVAAWTAYAVIFKKSPVGLANDSMPNGIDDAGYTNVQTINDHDKLLMQQTIWEVVTAMNKYTNVLPPATAIAFPAKTKTELPRFFATLKTIGYTLIQPEFVSIKYYDLQGRIVCSLINKIQGPGSFIVKTPTALRPGNVYVREFAAGDFVAQEQFSVIR